MGPNSTVRPRFAAVTATAIRAGPVRDGPLTNPAVRRVPSGACENGAAARTYRRASSDPVIARRRSRADSGSSPAGTRFSGRSSGVSSVVAVVDRGGASNGVRSGAVSDPVPPQPASAASVPVVAASSPRRVVRVCSTVAPVRARTWVLRWLKASFDRPAFGRFLCPLPIDEV
ncbi:hypothetical protein BRD13_04360 [Halobacteriales archaeon SW_5_70_135]|nr:MAG: hypothetical protein BRD13_04360 [Halobacteriales archaeon SW_5_70_135]